MGYISLHSMNAEYAPTMAARMSTPFAGASLNLGERVLRKFNKIAMKKRIILTVPYNNTNAIIFSPLSSY